MADKHRWNYGSQKGRKKKRSLADSMNNQSGLGEAYNSTKPPSKTDTRNQYVPVPPDPTQAGGRKQSGLRKRTYASMAKKRRARDPWAI